VCQLVRRLRTEFGSRERWYNNGKYTIKSKNQKMAQTHQLFKKPQIRDKAVLLKDQTPHPLTLRGAPLGGSQSLRYGIPQRSLKGLRDRRIAVNSLNASHLPLTAPRSRFFIILNQYLEQMVQLLIQNIQTF
jgi:hypothetical protein